MEAQSAERLCTGLMEGLRAFDTPDMEDPLDLRPICMINGKVAQKGEFE